MRRFLLPACLSALSAVSFAQSGKELVAGYVQQLNSAKALTATYTVQTLGDVPHDYKVELAKPNLAKIDSDTEMIVADGTDITTYNKKLKTFYKMPDTSDSLIALFNDAGLNLWQGFFDPAAMSKLPEASLGGPKVKRGKQVTEVDAIMDWEAKKKETFFFDSNGLAQQVEVKLHNPDSTTLVLIDSVDLGTKSEGADHFTFDAPSGSHEVSLEDSAQGRWYHSFEDALTVAAATHKLLLLEFASNGGPSKQMDDYVFSQQEFQDMSKSYVFCKLDVGKDPSLATKYKVQGTPDTRLLNNKGEQITSALGVISLQQLVATMQQILKANPAT